MNKKRIALILFAATLLLLNISGVSAAVRTTEYVTCGDGNLEIPKGIPTFLSGLVTLAKVLIPVLIIVLGMVRFLKAMASGDDKVIKSSTSAFIRSLIAGVAVFVVFAITQTAFNLISDATGSDFFSCASCFINNDGCEKTSYTPSRK